MSSREWQEILIAGKLFAALTDRTAFHHMIGGESLTINHGKLFLEMRDGRRFEIAVRLVSEIEPAGADSPQPSPGHTPT